MGNALTALYTSLSNNASIANALNANANSLGSPSGVYATSHASMHQHQQQLLASLNQLLPVCVQTQQTVNTDAVRSNYILSYLHTLVSTPEVTVTKEYMYVYLGGILMTYLHRVC
jgi:hypothetical protein